MLTIIAGKDQYYSKIPLTNGTFLLNQKNKLKNVDGRVVIENIP